MAIAQESGYLTNRIKPGDILYLDGQGQEGFVDYREWDSDNPPGTALGVVFYSYYGTRPCDAEGQAKGWHGWVVALDESEPCAWAPENTLCYNHCVASHTVDGVDTPWNPHALFVSYANGDTCGWQNTKRFLDYVYTENNMALSEEVSPAFHYIFAEKNGVQDLSQKPVMQDDTWYLLSYGQLRVLYGYLGCVNKAMVACGGTMLSEGSWYSSTEVGPTCEQAVWCYHYDGYTSVADGWLKKHERQVRAVRSF